MTLLVLVIACGAANRPAEPVPVLKPDDGPIHEPRKPDPPPPTKCAIRISADGVQLDGEFMKPEQVVSKCKTRQRAKVEIVEGGDFMVWERMRSELEAAQVGISVSGAREQGGCDDNPIAKGCN